MMRIKFNTGKNDNMKYLLALCSLLFLSLNVQGAVENTAVENNNAVTLSMDECIALAKAHNREVQAAGSGRRYYEYAMKSMKANFLPSLSLYARGFYSTIGENYTMKDSYLKGVAAKYPELAPYLEQLATSPLYGPLKELIHFEYDLEWTFMGGITLQQPIYMGGKVSTGYKMAKLGAEIAAQNVRLTESQVIVEASKAYANVVKAKEMHAVADKYNVLLVKLMKDVESTYKRGLASKNDVLKVKVKLNESSLNLKKASNALRLATMNLCHIVGKPLTSQIDVDANLPVYDAGILGEAMITERPEYMMYDKKEQLALQQVKLERSDKLPQIGLMAQYGYTNGLKLYGTTLFNSASFLAGVNLSVPLFHFGEKNNRMRAAKAKYEQARLERENINELMILEATRAANNYEESVLELEMAASALESADENLRMSGKEYAAGMGTLSDLLEAQVMWQSAYQSHIEAKTSTFVNWLEYRKAIGKLN